MVLKQNFSMCTIYTLYPNEIRATAVLSILRRGFDVCGTAKITWQRLEICANPY
jgi:hypothetical protein